jgi:6-pyruvoyltetrahydropterin/6-carboxytetrahydropterin synthase
MAFSVCVDGIRFAAGHFATFGGQCEPLHGHSYEVAAEVTGSLAEDSWVADFRGLKRALRDICDELDHKFILQCDSRELVIERSRTAWKVRTPAGLEYAMPLSDVAALPIDNSTAERLAEYLAQSLRAQPVLEAPNVESVTVDVWEGPGQRARYVLDIDGSRTGSLAASKVVDNNAKVVRRMGRDRRLQARQPRVTARKTMPDGRTYVEPNRPRG